MVQQLLQNGGINCKLYFDQISCQIDKLKGLISIHSVCPNLLKLNHRASTVYLTFKTNQREKNELKIARTKVEKVNGLHFVV